MSVTVTKFGDMAELVDDGNELAIYSIVNDVVNECKALSPVEFGQLKNGWMARVKGSDIGFNQGGSKPAERKISPVAKAGEGYVGNAVEHVVWNEFGTRKMAAQPMIRPAIAAHANGQDVKRALKKYQNQAVAAGMRKGPRVKKEYQ